MTLIRRDFLALAAGAAFAGAFARATAALAAGEGYATGDMALGNAEASVTVIEYASMTCPHCATFHNDVYPGFKAAYIDTGKINFIFRDFPLDQMALLASMLARCAGPDRYFGFLEVLFKQQASWARSKDPGAALARIGRLGGIGKKAFEACVKDRGLADTILARRIEAVQKFDVSSTPSFVINGELHRGIMSLERFASVIEPLLAKQ